MFITPQDNRTNIATLLNMNWMPMLEVWKRYGDMEGVDPRRWWNYYGGVHVAALWIVKELKPDKIEHLVEWVDRDPRFFLQSTKMVYQCSETGDLYAHPTVCGAYEFWMMANIPGANTEEGYTGLISLWAHAKAPVEKHPKHWLGLKETETLYRDYLHHWTDQMTKLGAKVLGEGAVSIPEPSPILLPEEIDLDPIKAAFMLGQIKEVAEDFETPDVLAREYARWIGADPSWVGVNIPPNPIDA